MHNWFPWKSGYISLYDCIHIYIIDDNDGIRDIFIQKYTYSVSLINPMLRPQFHIDFP